MSTPQYLRKLSVILADSQGEGIDVSQLRCVFTVRRGDFQTPNSVDLRMYNLSADTANRIAGHEFTQIVVAAGYEGNFGQIFAGTIVQRRLGRESAIDTYMDITAADGDEAYNFATISQSIASAKPDSVAAILLTAMQRFNQDINAGYKPNFPQSGSVRGQVLYGNVKDELRDFCMANNVRWSIQDGKLTFIPLNGYIPGQVLTISPSSGLIGIPEQTSGGINVRVLLNPSIKIGTTIKLDSTINKFRFALDTPSASTTGPKGSAALTNKLNADGLYYVMVAEYQGDTRGQPWYTNLTCLSVDATILASAQANALFATMGAVNPQ
jgi:hypothetical protein